MNSSNEFKAIAELDLRPIKVKLMHEESGEGWSLEKADAIEFEYRRFLYLMKLFPQEQTAPLADVDTFWHYHILDTVKYAVDCQQVFGYFLHHFPYIGLRGPVDEEAHKRVGERMRELYEQTFGEPYIREVRTQAGERIAYSGSATGTAYSGVAVQGAPAQRSAATAYSGVAVQERPAQRSNATAYSGVAVQEGPAQRSNATAYSGVAVQEGPAQRSTATAYSGVAVQGAPAQRSTTTAYSGVATGQPAIAYSGVAPTSQVPGHQGPAVSSFYSERPVLAAA